MKDKRHWLTWGEPLFLTISLVIVILAIIAILVGIPFFHLAIEPKAVDWSTWLNNIAAPFFGLAGTIMLLLNFFRQRKDADDNHNELLKQREESDFLQLITLQHQNKQSIQANFQGDFFEVFHKDISDYYQNAKIMHGNNTDKIDQYIHEQYRLFYLQYYDHIDHFLLHIEYIFKLVEDSPHFKERDKEKKMKLLSAQLSTNELFMLFYHYFCTQEIAQLQAYNKWHFFDRLYHAKPKTHLLDIRHKQS